MRTLRLLAPLLLVLPSFAQDVYRIDSTHSQVGFKIRHFVAKTAGRFTDFEGTITVDPKDMGKSSVQMSLKAASINTDNADRDAHLRKADFFDVEKFPTITFKSTSVKEVTKGRLEVTGDLTMHGVTRSITFPIASLGAQAGPRGGVVAGFGDGLLKLNRHDFGISYGKGVLGDEVEISLDVEAVKVEPKAASSK